MSSAIEETGCPEFQRLNGCDLSFPVGHLVALNGTEFVLIPQNTHRFRCIYKYNVANDQWTSVMSLEKECTIPGAVFDPNTTTLYLLVHHKDVRKRGLQWIDTEQWAVRMCLEVPKSEKYDIRVILVGGEIHCLYPDGYGNCRHFVVNKVSGVVIQEQVEIQLKLIDLSKPMFVASRSSIVVAGASGMGGSTIVEYSLTTKQWKIWEWAHACAKDYFPFYGSFVSAWNGRYILSFSGVRDGIATDSIMIYDAERKHCVESELKLPVKCEFCQAVLMSDQTRKGLLTFGFVRRCYKAEEFQNMSSLPTSLITLIGKCFEVEFIHLILLRQKHGVHYRVNVDEILKCVPGS